MKENKSKLILFFSLISLLIFTSCSLWRDFTTYFNTYYNAHTLFVRTEEDILKKRTDVFAFRYEAISTQQFNDLTKVIEKCSKILQFDKESSYFDDALFLTGKAFYYQQEYARAQRKFIELSAFPESEYALENKLWLANTHLQLRNFNEGVRLLTEVQTEALNKKDEKIFIDASISKIAFYIFREEYQAAVDECQNFLNKLNDDEVAALVWYQMGRIYVLLNEEENALNAFASVLKHSPTFDIEFESRLEYAKLLNEIGRIDESETALNDLFYQGKFKEQQDRIMLELGQIYNEKDELEKAISIFMEIDSTYQKKPTAALAQMMLGKIYEYKIRDYDSSYKYYNKAASSTTVREIKVEATSHNKNFDKYFSLKNTIKDLNLQLAYITNPDKFIRDSVDYDIAYNQYLEENKKQLEQRNLQGELSPAQRIQQRGLETPQQKQQKQQADTTKQSNKKLTLIELIAQGKIKKPVRPKISRDSVNTLISQNLYNLGNLFLTELEVPDSAYFYFNKVINNYEDRPYKVDALFALGTYYETNDQKEKADSLYKIIYDNYPNHKLHIEAGKKLGLIKSEDKKIAETNDPAEQLYIAAEEKYYNKKYKEAIREFRNIYLNYPRSTFAPKSILCIGMIYEEQMQNDSAAFFYGILSSKEYASTPYGKAVLAKYTEYKNEKERLEKEAKEKEEAEKRKAELQKIKETDIENPKAEMPVIKKDLKEDENPLIKKSKPDSINQNNIQQQKRNIEKADSVKADSSRKQKVILE